MKKKNNGSEISSLVIIEKQQWLKIKMEISLFELQGKKILRITTHRKGNREIDKNVEGIN